MENKKNNVLVIILTIIVIVLGGFIVYDKFIVKEGNSNNVSSNTTTVNEQKKNENQKVLKKDSSKELVYGEVIGSITDKVGNTTTYEIPSINIDSEYATQVNDEISSKIKKIYEEEKEEFNKYMNSTISEGNAYGGTNIKYKYYVNNNILSLVVSESPSFGVTYYIYNIDIYSGNKVSNNEILLSKNMNAESFKNKIIESFNHLEKDNMLNSEYAKSDAEFCKSQYDKNISNLSTNSIDSYQMYLNDKNDLNVVYIRENIAGGERSTKIINIDTNEYVEVVS